VSNKKAHEKRYGGSIEGSNSIMNSAFFELRLFLTVSFSTYIILSLITDKATENNTLNQSKDIAAMVNNSSQKILSADCWSTVFVKFEVNVLADSR